MMCMLVLTFFLITSYNLPHLWLHAFRLRFRLALMIRRKILFSYDHAVSFLNVNTIVFCLQKASADRPTIKPVLPLFRATRTSCAMPSVWWTCPFGFRLTDKGMIKRRNRKINSFLGRMDTNFFFRISQNNNQSTNHSKFVFDCWVIVICLFCHLQSDPVELSLLNCHGQCKFIGILCELFRIMAKIKPKIAIMAQSHSINPIDHGIDKILAVFGLLNKSGAKVIPHLLFSARHHMIYIGHGMMAAFIMTSIHKAVIIVGGQFSKYVYLMDQFRRFGRINIDGMCSYCSNKPTFQNLGRLAFSSYYPLSHPGVRTTNESRAHWFLSFRHRHKKICILIALKSKI